MNQKKITLLLIFLLLSFLNACNVSFDYWKCDCSHYNELFDKIELELVKEGFQVTNVNPDKGILSAIKFSGSNDYNLQFAVFPLNNSTIVEFKLGNTNLTHEKAIKEHYYRNIYNLITKYCDNVVVLDKQKIPSPNQ